jgi:hypothetical protein
MECKKFLVSLDFSGNVRYTMKNSGGGVRTIRDAINVLENVLGTLRNIERIEMIVVEGDKNDIRTDSKLRGIAIR